MFLFYTFFLNLPKSLEEAARPGWSRSLGERSFVSSFQLQARLRDRRDPHLPQLVGTILWPLLVTSDPAVRPLPLQMGVFSAQVPPDWGQIFAFGTLLVLPVLVIFLIFQRYFVQSVAGSAVKG